MPVSTHHEDYRLLLTLLRDSREQKQVSQILLAQNLETTQSFISKVERGERRLDVIELIEICEALGIAPEQWIESFLQHRRTAHKKHLVKKKISI